jgi:hypothetical protein
VIAMLVGCGGGGTSTVDGAHDTTSCLPSCDAEGGMPPSYSTQFPLVENPISESGRWLGGAAGGSSLWGNMQTTAGLAFGVSEPTAYGDPTAILTAPWSADQSAQATVHIIDGQVTTGSCCHEVEVRLRVTIDPGQQTITGYEAYCSVMSDNRYCHIASWGGPNGVWVNMEASSPAMYVKEGDVLEGTVTGTNPVIITLYVNGTQIVQVQDTGAFTFSDGNSYGPWPTGAPGIGVYDNSDSNWADFGFSSFSATGM